MNKSLSVFNWSLTKALDTQADSFAKARIRIIYTILQFSLLKVFVVIGFGYANEQWLQVIRAVIALLAYLVLTKLLLYIPSRVKLISHIMLQIGLLLVWTNIFVFAQRINLISLQFVFMIVLSSFYTLGTRMGLLYSIFSISPVLLAIISHGSPDILPVTGQEFASPGFEIVVVLNFISIIIAHYLFYQAFHLSIKEKEDLNTQLQQSITEANKLAASKSNFLSTMSHELRTPLNSVIGITELLLADNPEKRQKENLEILHFSTLDLLSLINDILDFNKIDSDKMSLEAIPFRLDDFIQNRCAGLKLKAKDKNLQFNLDIDPQLNGTTVISDPTRLSQLIYNLVGNAIKFTDEGSITIKLDCINKIHNKADVLFSISDTGIGIAEDKHNAIFDLFTQAESHITRKYGGTGLGLAIVKQVLSLFNSTIHLESAPGKGTRFYFTISFEITSDNIDTKNVVNKNNPELKHLNILVAEDNELNRLIIKKQFNKLGLEPTIVENGKKALEAHFSGTYDAIFMDLHMPEMDGYETTQKIRAMKGSEKSLIPIIAFTASVTEQQKISESGFDDYLYKPVNMNDLQEKLSRLTLKTVAE